MPFTVSLAPHMDFASYVHQYYKSGYLVYQEAGEAGKVCVDHMNKTVPKSEVGRVLNKLGESMCNTLEYRDLVSIEIMVDNEQEVLNYFKLDYCSCKKEPYEKV